VARSRSQPFAFWTSSAQLVKALLSSARAYSERLSVPPSGARFYKCAPPEASVFFRYSTSDPHIPDPFVRFLRRYVPTYFLLKNGNLFLTSSHRPRPTQGPGRCHLVLFHGLHESISFPWRARPVNGPEEGNSFSPMCLIHYWIFTPSLPVDFCDGAPDIGLSSWPEWISYDLFYYAEVTSPKWLFYVMVRFLKSPYFRW